MSLTTRGLTGLWTLGLVLARAGMFLLVLAAEHGYDPGPPQERN